MDNNGDRFKENECENKPALLKAIEVILAKPEDIKKEVITLQEKYKKSYSGKKTDEEIRKMIAKKIVSNYSYVTSFIGGATGLTSVIPGLGQVIAAFGGATADTALTLKYQIEMVMALAVVFDHDIAIEEEKRLCMIIAGLGAINEAAKQGGKALGSKAFIKSLQQYLKGPTLQAVKEIFKKVGITFTRKGLEKAVPFGIGVVIGATANKGLAVYVGNRAIDFFECN